MGLEWLAQVDHFCIEGYAPDHGPSAYHGVAYNHDGTRLWVSTWVKTSPGLARTQLRTFISSRYSDKKPPLRSKEVLHSSPLNPRQYTHTEQLSLARGMQQADDVRAKYERRRAARLGDKDTRK